MAWRRVIISEEYVTTIRLYRENLVMLLERILTSDPRGKKAKDGMVGWDDRWFQTSSNPKLDNNFIGSQEIPKNTWEKQTSIGCSAMEFYKNWNLITHYVSNLEKTQAYTNFNLKLVFSCRFYLVLYVGYGKLSFSNIRQIQRRIVCSLNKCYSYLDIKVIVY